MKFTSIFLSSSLFFLIIFSSCKKDDAPALIDTSITAQVVSSANLSLLEAAVIKAELTGTLSGAGPFTVFAPTDAAFAASGITLSTIISLDTADLEAILLYHVLTSEVGSGSVPAGPNAKVITASGDSVFVTKNLSGVYVNGVMVSQADIDASNGVIHLISSVLIPPSGNIVETAQSISDFTFLVAAVLRASQGSTNIASYLSTQTPITVFAPTNAAFIAAGFADIAAINAASPDILSVILQHHVIAGTRVFSSDLTNGATVDTGVGVVTIGITGSGATVEGAANGTPSNIVAANIMARNGVIHVIDQVLLPAL